MQIELWDIGRVRPYTRNPRDNDGAVKAVAASLKEFGWRQPIVVDAEGVIVVGHTRWKAAQRLGLTQVPVHVATELTPAQCKAYRIADNQTATIAEWDYELLPLELTDLKALDFDLNLLATQPPRKITDNPITEVEPRIRGDVVAYIDFADDPANPEGCPDDPHAAEALVRTSVGRGGRQVITGRPPGGFAWLSPDRAYVSTPFGLAYFGLQ